MKMHPASPLAARTAARLCGLAAVIGLLGAGPVSGGPLTGAAVFTDAGLTTPGLTGSYVDRSLESVTAGADWRTSQVICGTRVDTNFARTTGDWGERAEVGVTGGSDENWDDFSVQWDGFLLVTEAGQRVATASDDGSRMWLDLDHDGTFAPDELLDNGWGGSQAVAVADRSGPLPAGACRVRIQYCEISGDNEFHLCSSSWVPRQFAPDQGNPRQTVRVVVLNFEPRIPSEGNRRLWEVFGWNDPRMLASQCQKDIAFMTGGAVAVEIVEWRDLDEFPLFTDGFRYAPDQYVANRRAGSGWHDGGADFDHLARQQNLAALVNQHQVDEIWCFGDHYFALFGEAWMAGPNPFFINGPTFPDAGFDRAVAGYGFNYERGVAEMIHNLGHRTENHGQRAYGSWNLANPTTAFDRFSANYLESPGHTPGVGTCHVPANADAHYNYDNLRVVQASAFDWPDYPALTSTTTAVSRGSWAFGPAPDCQRDYLAFYFGMMPRNAGAAPDGRQANWFKYIWDFNGYEAGTGLPRDEDAIGSGTTVRSAGGTTHKFTVRYYDLTGVEPATLGDGDVEVRGPGGFAQVATLAGVGDEVPTTAGTARTVTYRIDAPGGSWDATDGGTYRIWQLAGEVQDTDGNPFPAAEVGGFQVTLDDPAALNLRAMLANAEATVEHTAFDIGTIANLFDGNVSSLVRTPNIDPLVVTLAFAQPQTLHALRACFTGAWGDPAYQWQVETADCQADLDGRTGSWRQAVALTGTASDRYSTATLVTPVTAAWVRLTATRLTGDDYVHACEWQLIGPPVTDTAAPDASASCGDVSRPGGTAHFIELTCADDTGVDVASLHTGNLVVTGPGGFTSAAVFADVDRFFDGSPRTASYWIIPPGGAWESTDNGTYTVTLQPGSVCDTLGNSAALAQTLATFNVEVAAPTRRPAHDLTEANAVDWLAGADGATASTADDTGRKLLGSASVRFVTDGGFDTWLRFPPAYAADWDLTLATNLNFSVYAENTQTFQGNSPWIRLRGDNGGCFDFRFYQNGNPADPLNTALGTWQSFVVPLRAADTVTNGWRRTTTGAPALDYIVSLEFHADTWGSGFTLWYDRVGFDLPVQVVAAGMELAGGCSRLCLRFDDSVAATLDTDDLHVTDLATSLPVAPEAMDLVYLTESNTAQAGFPGLPSGRLADGSYRLVLPAGAVADPAGNQLAADFVFDFHVLDGDSDADLDGMADTWERSFSLDPTDPADAAADADADGQSNLAEYRSGTDPRDPASRLAIVAATFVAAGLQLTWHSVPGRQYRIRWSGDLLGWTTLTDGGVPVTVDASAAGDRTSHTVPVDGSPPDPARFYQIEAVPR